MLDKLYGRPKPKIRYRFRTGQSVRIKKRKKDFHKGYKPTFSEKVFIIAQPVPGRYPASYKVRTEEGAVLPGILYDAELANAGEEDGRILRRAQLKRR